MLVDLNQLPIPDWGLLCPQCRYPLVGLPTHRCPECGLKFRMEEIVPTWTPLRPAEFTGREQPLPDWGLGCRECDAKLAGAEAARCSACRTAFDPEDYRPKRPWFLVDEVIARGIVLPIIAIELDAAQIPYAHHANTGRLEAILGDRTAGRVLLVSSEYYFDVLELVRRVRAAAPPPGSPDRPCPHCGELSPPNFQVCWNCCKPL